MPGTGVLNAFPVFQCVISNIVEKTPFVVEFHNTPANNKNNKVFKNSSL